MKQRIELSIIVLIMLFGGCEHHRVLEPNENLVIEFYLTDSNDANTDTFDSGKDIYFHYSILNNSQKTQNYTISHSGPFISFEVFHADSMIGTSDDGFGFATVLVEGELLPDSTLYQVYSWLTNDNHSPLPAGEYIVRTRSNLWIGEITPSSYSKNIRFIVLP